MASTLYERVLVELQREDAAGSIRLLRRFYAVVDELVRIKREKFSRVLPLSEYFVDRWDKAALLGFGKGTSVYDSCLVIGDVRVGTDCWIGPFTILDGSGNLEIGDHCTISAGVHIYTHDNIAQTLSDAPIERSPVTIGSRVYIGPNTVVGRGVRIGDNVVVGANSLVLADIPSGSKAAGNPARVVGTVS